MYKALLLIVCLLVYTPMVMAQGLNPRRPAPSPARQEASPAMRDLTKEQFDRLRHLALEIMIRNYFEGQRTRVQGTLPTPDQRSWAPPPPLGGFPDFTPDPDLLKYGPFGPNINKGLGPLGEGQVGNVVNLPKGFTSPWDGLSQDLNKIKWSLEGLDLNLERITASTNAAIDAFKLFQQQQIAASNVVTMPSSAGESLPKASASSASSSTRLNVERKRVLVRANRNGFPIGTLFEDNDFVAKYRDGKKVYVEGVAKGNVQKPGWVKFKGTFGQQDPPAQTATKSHILLGDDSKRYLLNNYAFVINDNHSQPSPARITMPTLAYQNYTNGVPLDPLPRQLLPYDPVNNARKFAWRWITDDGKYVMGRECRIDPTSKGKTCADGAPTYWVYVSVCAVAIPGYSLPCRQ